MRLPMLVLALFVGFGLAISAQTQFDVASVKPVSRDVLRQKGLVCGFGSGGRFMAFGWLRYILACAYDIRTADPAQRILNGPKWVDSDLFEILAIAPPENFTKTPKDLLMLQALLADRFKLAVHRETKEIPMYALIVKQEGKLGSQMRRTPADCLSWIAGGRQGRPPEVSADLLCGQQRITRSSFLSSTMMMSQLANLLSPKAGKPVQDKTGLEGTFALNLQWLDDQDQADARDVPSTVFTALQEQLGLKLERTTGSIDLIVIDHVEPPTPN